MHKLAIVFALVFLPIASNAASMSDTDRYAWGDRTGWVNFSPSKGSVQVTESGMTGYAWSATLGWINLSPLNGGVLNDGRGNLSGFAWGEHVGWIDFDGVSIDSSGVFSGSATSLSAGTIHFSCTHCLVRTSWVPVSVSQDAPTGGSRSGTSRRNIVPGLSWIFNWPTTDGQIEVGGGPGAVPSPLPAPIIPVQTFSASSSLIVPSDFVASTSRVSQLSIPPAPSSSLIAIVEQASSSTTPPEESFLSKLLHLIMKPFSTVLDFILGLFV